MITTGYIHRLAILHLYFLHKHISPISLLLPGPLPPRHHMSSPRLNAESRSFPFSPRLLLTVVHFQSEGRSVFINKLLNGKFITIGLSISLKLAPRAEKRHFLHFSEYFTRRTISTFYNHPLAPSSKSSFEASLYWPF